MKTWAWDRRKLAFILCTSAGGAAIGSGVIALMEAGHPIKATVLLVGVIAFSYAGSLPRE